MSVSPTSESRQFLQASPPGGEADGHVELFPIEVGGDSQDHHAEHKIPVTLPSDEEDSPPSQPREWPSVLQDGWAAYFKRSLWAVCCTSWLNILFIAFPFALAAWARHWGDTAVFVLSLIALCPLAERISFVTEDISKYTNDTIGGLLNATMGNATELIVSVFALKEGLLRVVQVSLLGSVLSNLLLVLGFSFLVGGARRSQQTFNRTAAGTNTGLLLLAVLGLMFPMLLTTTHDDESPASALKLSRVTGVALLIVYGLFIFYQLKTHTHLFEDEGEDDEDDEPPQLGFAGAIIWCAIITGLISLLSEMLVSAIEGAAKGLGVPVLFIGTILLPIVGNAAEHAAALIFAYKNKLDLSLGIAVGSATQIALFVIPLMVVLGWMMGQPLSLDFHVFETACLLLTVLIVSSVLASGTSDWLRGVMLLVAYFLVAASFWVHGNPADLQL